MRSENFIRFSGIYYDGNFCVDAFSFMTEFLF